MAVSVRVRFEVFKRDDFTCRYCGRKSPEVVLEVDHVVPVCEGGTDDPMNLVTSCWDCNRGKAGVSLNDVITGEDPHDRAVLLLERERQLREYNTVLEEIYARKSEDLHDLEQWWLTGARRELDPSDRTWVMNTLDCVPVAVIRRAMDLAILNRKTRGLGYVNALVKKWLERGDI